MEAIDSTNHHKTACSCKDTLPDSTAGDPGEHSAAKKGGSSTVLFHKVQNLQHKTCQYLPDIDWLQVAAGQGFVGVRVHQIYSAAGRAHPSRPAHNTGSSLIRSHTSLG